MRSLAAVLSVLAAVSSGCASTSSDATEGSAEDLTTGKVDSTFGASGSVTFSGDAFTWGDAIELSNGNLLVVRSCAGSCTDPSAPAEVVRLDGKGAPDPTFGANGRTTLQALSSVIGFEELANGKIFLHQGRNFARLQADGTPDATFGPGGEKLVVDDKVLSLRPGKTFDVSEVAVDATTGDAFVFGSVHTPSLWPADAMRLYRFDAQGALDTAFNDGDGFVEFPYSKLGGSHLLAVEGKLYLTSPYFTSDSDRGVEVRRYTAAGADETFGDRGVVRIRSEQEPGLDAPFALEGGRIGLEYQRPWPLAGVKGMVVALDPSGKVDSSIWDGGRQDYALDHVRAVRGTTDLFEWREAWTWSIQKLTAYGPDQPFASNLERYTRLSNVVLGAHSVYAVEEDAQTLTVTKFRH